MANILIVEDEKNMQDIIAEYMKKGGHTCFTADDGIDALMILKSNPMDLMILDIMMPHIDGFTVCKMAREMSNMPIIMLTAKSEESDKLKGYEYGADDYQDEDDEMKKQKYAEIILSETERKNHQITTLLDLSALETGAVQLTPERFDFVELLETVAGRLLIDTPDVNFELQYELPDYKVYVCTDKLRMEQVLNNLIINAKKNVRPKGVLKLCLSYENGLLYFSVYNQGDTIPDEKLKKIWTKFYRDNRSKYSGSGLGLAIVAQILSMQGLSYGAKNLADGVQFYFSIPTVE